jgi:hypothetical protein
LPQQSFALQPLWQGRVRSAIKSRRRRTHCVLRCTHGFIRLGEGMHVDRHF